MAVLLEFFKFYILRAYSQVSRLVHQDKEKSFFNLITNSFKTVFEVYIKAIFLSLKAFFKYY